MAGQLVDFDSPGIPSGMNLRVSKWCEGTCTRKLTMAGKSRGIGPGSGLGGARESEPAGTGRPWQPLRRALSAPSRCLPGPCKKAFYLVGLARIELATSALSVRLKGTIWKTSNGVQRSDLRRWVIEKVPDGS
jgi:hypothetical protein